MTQSNTKTQRIAVSVLIVFTLILNAPSADSQNAPLQPPQFIPRSFADIAEHIRPAVVNISTSQLIGPTITPGEDVPGDDLFERFLEKNPPTHRFRRRSLGSGVIFSQEGDIITNNHVIEGADEIRVRLSDDQEFEAEIIGRDVKTDIALIQIKEGNDRPFPIAQFGDSDSLRVGDWVIAVGNPYGLSHTVTAGIISAKGRVIGGPYDDFLQTDASINPGNSGGPLININGEVVGISTAIFANMQGNRFAQGIGFAIPINIVSRVVNDLRLYGKVKRGWVGIVIQEVTPEIAASFNLPDARGALVSSVVPGGPADRAGIVRGDVVLQFNGTDIEQSIDLPRIAADSEPGATKTVVVNRDGKEIALQITLGEFPGAEEDLPLPVE
ncbi:trypsin-like serine protease [candidate division KSB3 bacterium]|uniref:Probable periplasmic serine endoprotease DegP-like n=1 Tax=candidate division KSB3 bacterium TaxID=2044937 RepID=A0A9D5JZ71_9BACT|nr:trypsin-like serine protease [candidate division KSB3 bacterium]MBD3326933.1 trypsin-like serine protease [candidate division KSB3 bacterium]